jgi:hypothetical protein
MPFSKVDVSILQYSYKQPSWSQPRLSETSPQLTVFRQIRYKRHVTRELYASRVQPLWERSRVNTLASSTNRGEGERL